MRKITCTFFIVLFIMEIILMSTLQVDVKAVIKNGTVIENVKDIFSGHTGNMMYLLEGDTLFAGGINLAQGQLGTPTTSGKLSTIEQVNLDNVAGNIVNVEIAYNYSVLLDDRGYVYTTGANNYGQLGMGDTSNLTVFTKVPLPAGVIITDITAGPLTAYALASNGDLYGWGAGARGALNQGGSPGESEIHSTPTVIATDVDKISASKSGGNNTTYNALYLVKKDGNLYVCGYNKYGQLGLGHTDDLTTLTNIPFFNNLKIEQIQAGSTTAFVLLKDGTAYAAGNNGSGSLGVNGSTINSKTPGLGTGNGNVTTWAPIVIPTYLTIEKLFRCSTSQMYQLSNKDIWGTGANGSGNMGFYSTENTWNPGSSADKYLMTDICSRNQVELNGSLKVPINSSQSTDQSIYGDNENSPIKALSGSSDASFMVDAKGFLRVAGDSADSYTSLDPYALENTSAYQFHKMQINTTIIKDPRIYFHFPENETTIKVPIAGVEKEIAVNPTTIKMGPPKSDTIVVNEKYEIFKYNTSTGEKEGEEIASSYAPVNTDLLTFTIADDPNLLIEGDYLIEVTRLSIIPPSTILTSRIASKIFRIAQNVTLTYDSNSGISNAPSKAMQYPMNSEVIVSDNTYTKGGYSFVEWNTAPDGSGTSYSPKATFKIQEDTTLYAQWTPSSPHHTINTEKDIIILADKYFILDINEIDETNGLSDKEIIEKSNAGAWTLSDGTDRKLDIQVQVQVKKPLIKKVGPYEVTLSVDGVEIKTYAHVVDPNTAYDTNKNIAIYAKSFVISLDKRQSITDKDILDESSAKVWNLVNGSDLINDVKVDQKDLGDSMGSYLVKFSLNGVEKQIRVSIIDPDHTAIDESKDTIIYAKNFSTTLAKFSEIDILKDSDAFAWKISTNDNLTKQLIISPSSLLEKEGPQEVTLSLNGVTHEIYVTILKEEDKTLPTIDKVEIVAPPGYEGKPGQWSNKDIKLKISVSDNVEVNSDSYEVSYGNESSWINEDFYDKTKDNANLIISSEGLNQIIYVRVKDISDNMSKHYKIGDEILINIDKTPPLSNYINNETYKVDELEVISFIDDLSGIASAELNSVPITSCVETPGIGDHTLIIHDKAGNTATINFTVKN